MESWDLVQDVLIDALRKVPSFEFRTEGAFLKYLNQVVANRIRDEADRWGAQKRDMNREISLDEKRAVGAEIPLDTPGDRAAASPSEIVSRREELTRLERALDRLGEESGDYRDLIVAVKIEGQTYREIAEETGTTEDAVRMRLKRAVLALTRIYEGMDGGG